MENKRVVVGLDIGTTKICAIVGGVDSMGKLNILGMGKAPSEGLNRGVVTNIEKTVRSIRQAVEDAEQVCGLAIQSVIVGIAGDHIQSFQSRGIISTTGPDNEITEKDVNRLIADTKKIALPADRQIIHVIPQEFIVDGQDGVVDPVGMAGVRMEANVHIITGQVSAIRNIERCVEKANLKVDDIVLEPIASSLSVLTPEEKEVGVALLDIGGGTTDLAIFEEKTIRKTVVIAIAGKKVTDDIRKGLGILQDQAEDLKIKQGVSHMSEIIEDDRIVIPGISGRPPKEITKSMLCQIIQPRMEEILEMVASEIYSSGYAKSLSAGLVITGGGALIKGTSQLAREIVGLDVKIGIPSGSFGGLIGEVENPIYSTAVGLVVHGLRTGKATQAISRQGLESIESQLNADSPSGNKAEKSSMKVSSLMEKIKAWFDEL